jgi:succinate-semialdehyde dehydrogenase / glutarate-semialdehyde dehydrogenase
VTTVQRPHDVIDRKVLDQLVDSIVASPRAELATVVAPFTGKPLAEVPLSTEADVDAAFETARDAQRGWAARPVRERARVVGRIHDLILDRQSEVADLLQLETGKARRDAYEEIANAALAARYVAARGPSMLRDRRRLGLAPGLTRAIEVRHPKGVVGVISPWNYPLTLGIGDHLAAFVAGNAVVHKPDMQAPLTPLLARSMAVEAGIPEGLWQLVVGSGPAIGGAIVQRADFLSFTGSTAVGRLVARQSGERLVGASLELGGKNPMLVLEDAPLDRAAECAIRACFANAGQLCVGVERVYVAERIRDAFLDRFLDRVRGMRVGAALDYSVDMGSLMSQAQLDRVVRHLEDAVAKGSTVLAGGHPRPELGPWFFEPTVLDGVRPGMLAYDEETFGPLVSVGIFRTDDEAVALANDTPYGLNASVWTGNLRRGTELARRIQAGMVNVNEGYAGVYGSHDLPHGGMGASGLGRRHGRDGILRFTEVQSIAAQRLHGFTPLPGQTYDQFTRAMTLGLRVLRRLGRP